MPQTMTYTGNSVIYFRGDASKKIYILQSGRVVLKRDDIESMQEVQEPIQTGEFFGVKSALGKFDRDEDAIVVSDSVVVVFTVEEFEALVMTNSRVGMKMLKVFSNQLRRIHGKVQTLLAVEDRNPEEGMFSSAEFYLKKKRYSEGIAILKRYIKYYPTGRFIDQANKYLKTAEQYLSKYGNNGGPAMINEGGANAAPAGPKKKQQAESSAGEKAFYDALSLSSQGKFQDAIAKFQAVLDETSDESLKENCSLEIAKALLGGKQFDACVRHIGTMLKTFPEHSEFSEAMFMVGQAYEGLGDKAKALSVYERVLGLGDKLTDEVKKKAKHAQRALGA